MFTDLEKQIIADKARPTGYQLTCENCRRIIKNTESKVKLQMWQLAENFGWGLYRDPDNGITYAMCPDCLSVTPKEDDPTSTKDGRRIRYKSVLQDWVGWLPLREQGTLLTAVRGCDLTPKLPLDSIERQLVCGIRYTFMNPADEREVGVEPGAFFQPSIPAEDEWRASELGHYPQHWYAHLMHASEVVAYRHPDQKVRDVWFGVYQKLAHNLHLHVETKDQMVQRLSEDRISKGSVVS